MLRSALALFAISLCMVASSQAANLFSSIQDNDAYALQAAIVAGADVDAADEYGQTPLMYAVTYNRVGMVRSLLASGANVNARSLAGWTALHYAARDAATDELVSALVAAQADVGARTGDGLTAIELAVEANNRMAEEALLRSVAQQTDLPPNTQAGAPAGTTPSVSAIAEMPDSRYFYQNNVIALSDALGGWSAECRNVVAVITYQQSSVVDRFLGQHPYNDCLYFSLRDTRSALAAIWDTLYGNGFLVGEWTGAAHSYGLGVVYTLSYSGEFDYELRFLPNVNRPGYAPWGGIWIRGW